MLCVDTKCGPVVLFIAGAVKKMTAEENMADFDSAIIIRSRCFSHLSVCYFSALYAVNCRYISSYYASTHTERDLRPPPLYIFFFLSSIRYMDASYLYAHTAVYRPFARSRRETTLRYCAFTNSGRFIPAAAAAAN